MLQPNLPASSEMINQSGLLSPIGSMALRTRWTRRSVLVKVPSFSAKLTPGSTTSANLAVSVRRISWTTINSRFFRPAITCVLLGSESAGSSPMTYIPLICPVSAWRIISMRVSPGVCGIETFQAFSNLSRLASSATD